MTTGEQPLRIGTTERTASMKALDAHLEAGRLGVEEYADRSAVAAGATTSDELAGLFTDLPAPHPALPDRPTLTATAPLPAVAPTGAVAERDRGFLDVWGPRIVAVTPIIALVLFFAVDVSNSWLFFLLIPIVSGLVYGGRHGHDGDDRDRATRRQERQERRDQR